MVIVEDQTIFRELLAEVLARSPDCTIVGEFERGEGTVQSCVKLAPDLLILDAVLPDMNGIDLLAELKEKLPKLRVVIVTAHARPALVRRSIELGAHGFVTKGTPLHELREAVERVIRNGRYYCSEATRLLSEAIRAPEKSPELTKRQRRIVQLVAQGLSSKEIAQELELSLKTVANHRLKIREKLGLHDVAGLTRYAIENGLVEAKA